MIAPGDPATNRRLLADRLGWPKGTVEKCNAVEADFPDWIVWWTAGGLPRDTDPGFRATLMRHNETRELYAPTIEELREKVRAAQQEAPHGPWLPEPWILPLIDRGNAG